MKSQQNRAYFTLTLAYAGFLMLGLGSGILGVAWPTMRAEFGMALDAMSYLLVAGTIGYTLVSANSGRLAQRYGMRWLLVGGVLTTALASFLQAFAPVWLVLIAGAFFASAGAAALDAGLNLYAAAHYSPRVMNWLHASFGFGSVLSPLMMRTIFEADRSWRVGYVVAGVLNVALATACFFAVWRSLAVLSQPDGVSRSERLPLRATIRLPLVWLSVSVFALYVGAEITPGNWSYSFLTEGRLIDTATASLWVSFFWGGLTAGRVFFGLIAHRFKLETILRVAMALGVLALLALWFGGTSVLTFAGLTLLGFSQGPIFPLLMSATPGRLGQHAANAIGLQMAMVGIGSAAFPSLAGILANRIGLEIIPPFVLLLTVAMIAIHEALIARSRRPVAAAA
ncbi:MAG: MFS transporter [Chloroflexi bacterium]|nr:MFS transporter [Chloroflexota bacterium]